MSFVGISVPHDVGRLLHTIDVPGDKVTVDEMHATLLYIGKGVSLDTIGRAVMAAAEVAEATRPFRMSVETVTTFPKNDDGVPVICPVISPDLHELNARLKAAFDAHGVEYSKTYPEFKPHVTLAYAKESIEVEAFGPLEWSAYEMVLWGGDAGDDRVSAKFPFAFPKRACTEQKLIKLLSNLAKP